MLYCSGLRTITYRRGEPAAVQWSFLIPREDDNGFILSGVNLRILDPEDWHNKCLYEERNFRCSLHDSPSCLMTRYQLHQIRDTSVTSQTVCTAIWWDIIWVSSISAAITMRWLFPERRLPRVIAKIMVWGFPKRSMRGQKNLHRINWFLFTSQ